jgi:biopolymer transport protein ExbB
MGFEGLSIFDILKKGGVAMWPLLGCSVIMVMIILNRWTSLCFRFRRVYQDAEELTFRIEDIVMKGGIREAVTMCEVTDGPLARIFKAGLIKHDRSKEEFLEAIEVAKAQEAKLLKKHIWGLATIGSTAPFIGLFGTVIGIMRAFSSIAATGASGISVVAGGIAEALIATATGLVIAVIAVVAYNYFQQKTGEIMHALSVYSLRLIDLIGDRRGW